MPDIVLPGLLEQLLIEQRTTHGQVLVTVDAFEVWFNASRTPFFPEYTDHGPDHISAVLRSAAGLISDASTELITANDAAVLIAAVLLHDSAMHLTLESFSSIVTNDDAPMCPDLDQRSWASLWVDYRAEVHRLNGRQLHEIVGSSEPLDLGDDPWTFEQPQLMLAGEFIRRHHTRLAHEFARVGVPAPPGSARIRVGLDEPLADLAGLVARSHGMSMRSAVAHLPENGRRERYGTHVPFLMAVLRIADYIQLDAERANQRLLSVRALRSPISQREWRTHWAFTDIHQSHSDPEALYVEVAPETNASYRKIRRLLDDVQSELDATWACLGEIYGRWHPISSLGLTLRRIRSNIDDPQGLEHFPFVPSEARLRVDDETILPLLVGPLYRDRAGIGVRELTQNATDAVKELWDLVPQRNEGADGAPDVEVMLVEDSGLATLSVRDRGVGMSLSTIEDYFLVAGASFRASEVWQGRHAAGGTPGFDRSGRFGIGALAAFLLGDEARITTRSHLDDSGSGFEFTVTREGGPIEIHRVAAEVGTTVSVTLTETSLASLKRGKGDSPTGSELVWYVLDSPRVEVTHVVRSDDPAEPDTVERLKPPGPAPSTSWIAVEDPGPYRSVRWNPQREMTTSGYPGRSHGVQVIVNGFQASPQPRGQFPSQKVEIDTDLYWRSSSEHRSRPPIDIRRPTVVIEDPFGVAPLALQRDAITLDAAFDLRLASSIVQHFTSTAAAALHDVDPADVPAALAVCDRVAEYPWLSLTHLWDFDGVGAVPFVLTRNGVSLLDESALGRHELTTLVLIPSASLREDEAHWRALGPPPPTVGYVLLRGPRDDSLGIDASGDDYRGRFWENVLARQIGMFGIDGPMITGVFGYCPEADYQVVFGEPGLSERQVRMPRSPHRPVGSGREIVGRGPGSVDLVARVEPYFPFASATPIVAFALGEHRPDPRLSLLSEAWIRAGLP